MTDDELGILLALNGNKRIEYLEEEIFSDTELVMVYLTALNNDGLVCYHETDISAHIYFYVAEVIKGRWIVAEPYLIKSPSYASWYAEEILHKRWLEAEQYIMKDRYWWANYCNDFGIKE